MLQNIRAFFAQQGVLEVDTPVLSAASITDPHISSFKTIYQEQVYYLQTSPEFFMKRLLAAGAGDIYQIARVFREDEQGHWHNPEFSMLEWYRTGQDHHGLMDEIEQLLAQLVNTLDTTGHWSVVNRISYEQAFIDILGINPLDASCAELKHLTSKNKIEIPVGMDEENKDMWLDWLMTQAIAPAFSKQEFTFLYDYPASQAALARIGTDNPGIAHRFEIFAGELELGNGFYELIDAQEQGRRFDNENLRRQRQGQEEIPVDKNLLAALEHGLPECSGVAIGLDRLLMVLLGKAHITEVVSFGISQV